MKVPKISRKKLVLLVAGVVIAVLVVSVVVLKLRDNSSQKDDSQNNELQALDAQQPITDVETLSVAQIRQEYPDKTQRFGAFMTSGLSKNYYGKFDQAMVYFRAALEDISPADKAKIERTRYQIYSMAIDNKNTDVQQEFKNLLGQQAIDRIKAEKQANEND